MHLSGYYFSFKTVQSAGSASPGDAFSRGNIACVKRAMPNPTSLRRLEAVSLTSCLLWEASSFYCSFLVIVVCTYGCYRSLESRRASLSKRALINPIICSFLTFFSCFTSMLLFWFLRPPACTVYLWSATKASFHSVASHLVCLMYKRSYRKAC